VIASRYGLELSSFVVENVSVPVEVEQAIDRRSGMAAVGNLNDYVKYQMAQGLERGGGAAGAAAELAVGLSLAQQMVQAQGGVAPDLLSPADVARRLAVPESDVLAIIQSGELAAKKIGESYRVKRSELDAFLSR
jgi:excisionase family DNA binding protein